MSLVGSVMSPCAQVHAYTGALTESVSEVLTVSTQSFSSGNPSLPFLSRQLESPPSARECHIFITVSRGCCPAEGTGTIHLCLPPANNLGWTRSGVPSTFGARYSCPGHRNSLRWPGPHCFQNVGSPYHSHHPNLFKDETIRNTIGELMS